MQLFVILTTSIFGQSMAGVIGPYLLIILAASTGAAWSLGRCKLQSKTQALFYFTRIVCTAILLTVAISKVTASFMSNIQEEWLIAPVALIIGLIGDDWHKIGTWMLQVIKKLVDQKIDRL